VRSMKGMVEAGTGEGKQKGLVSIPREVPSNISAVVASMHTSALCIARDGPLGGLNWFLCPDYVGAPDSDRLTRRVYAGAPTSVMFRYLLLENIVLPVEMCQLKLRTVAERCDKTLSLLPRR